MNRKIGHSTTDCKTVFGRLRADEEPETDKHSKGGGCYSPLTRGYIQKLSHPTDPRAWRTSSTDYSGEQKLGKGCNG